MNVPRSHPGWLALPLLAAQLAFASAPAAAGPGFSLPGPRPAFVSGLALSSDAELVAAVLGNEADGYRLVVLDGKTGALRFLRRGMLVASADDLVLGPRTLAVVGQADPHAVRSSLLVFPLTLAPDQEAALLEAGRPPTHRIPLEVQRGAGKHPAYAARLAMAPSERALAVVATPVLPLPPGEPPRGEVLWLDLETGQQQPLAAPGASRCAALALPSDTEVVAACLVASTWRLFAFRDVDTSPKSTSLAALSMPGDALPTTLLLEDPHAFVGWAEGDRGGVLQVSLEDGREIARRACAAPVERLVVNNGHAVFMLAQGGEAVPALGAKALRRGAALPQESGASDAATTRLPPPRPAFSSNGAAVVRGRHGIDEAPHIEIVAVAE